MSASLYGAHRSQGNEEGLVVLRQLMIVSQGLPGGPQGPSLAPADVVALDHGGRVDLADALRKRGQRLAQQGLHPDKRLYYV